MAKACFVFYKKYSSPSEWLSLSGIHQKLPPFMPVRIPDKKIPYGQKKLSLDSITVSAVRKPIVYEQVLGAKINYIVKAMREVGTIEISNPVPAKAAMKAKGIDVVHKIYVNISTYEKSKNPLSSIAERITAYAPFSVAFTAVKTAIQLGMTASDILRDLGLKNRRIRFSMTDHPQNDTFMVIERPHFTFNDMADILEKMSNRKRDHNEIRLVLDELFRNGVSIASGLTG